MLVTYPFMGLGSGGKDKAPSSGGAVQVEALTAARPCARLDARFVPSAGGSRRCSPVRREDHVRPDDRGEPEQQSSEPGQTGNRSRTIWQRAGLSGAGVHEVWVVGPAGEVLASPEDATRCAPAPCTARGSGRAAR